MLIYYDKSIAKVEIAYHFFFRYMYIIKKPVSSMSSSTVDYIINTLIIVFIISRYTLSINEKVYTEK